ncbi:MAG: ComEA family DNA-binding protein [Arenimonas sp.]
MNKFFAIVKTFALTALLATSAFAAEKVNINAADAASLDRVLVGVGPSKAEAIVMYRKQHGAFKSADQLAGVKGIGLATIEKNRDRIVLGGVVAGPVKAAPGKVLAAKPAPAKTR